MDMNTLREGEEFARAAAAAIARQSYGKLVAFLASRSHDVASAEDALSEAFAAALVDWPKNGCPSNPEGWLLTVARRRLIDFSRKKYRDDQAAARLLVVLNDLNQATLAREIPDERLGLMFACAHPSIEENLRAPLILQAVLGLSAKTIASAFLSSPAAMSKRLVRAKEKIRLAGIPFRVPEREELAERLPTVLDAIYASFGEGWTDANGTDVARRSLTGEAMYLARIVTEMLPNEAEALGLLGLMLHAEARRKARRGSSEQYIPLGEQDQRLWDAGMIVEAEVLLERAGKLKTLGRYQLECALQSAHVFRLKTGRDNWKEIVLLYDALFGMTGSPVVAINRALAISHSDGFRAGLSALDVLASDSRVSQYQPYWAVRAELLMRMGEIEDALTAYELAIGLESDPAVRRFLQGRQSAIRE